jgi:hypothetical protein
MYRCGSTNATVEAGHAREDVSTARLTLGGHQ